jgi:hypothetical protein
VNFAADIPKGQSEVGMAPIDLVEYAVFSKKIKADRLMAGAPILKQVTRYQLCMAHLIDILVVLYLAVFLNVIMRLALQPLLVTKQLQIAAMQMQHPFLLIFGLTFLGYFFSAYYLNQGQTYGGYRLKLRIHLPPQDLMASCRWIALTLMSYLSLGLATSKGREYFQQHDWGKIVTHDYLYYHLMLDRAAAPMDLVAQATSSHAEAAEDYQQAA